MQETDPLAVIAEDAPQFTDEAAIDVVRERYGLDVTVKTLVSERDQNFHLKTTDGREYVLKITNSAEAAAVTDFQIQALLHIAAAVERQHIPIHAPQVITATDGATQITLKSPAGTHVARIVTFLQGVPLAERVASPVLARNMGAYLAHLGRALRDFSHPGSQQSLLWDIQQAPKLRTLVTHIAEEAVADAVGGALDDFERYAEPLLSSVRSQVIHSDFNPDNVLIDADDSDVVAGVIDFGDMLKAPLVADVAIGASYLRTHAGDPLRLIAEFVAGYHGITPLTPAEIDLLLDLIQARLCASVTIFEWRLSLCREDDPYLDKLIVGEASSRQFLCRLRKIPRDSAQQVLRQVCV